jgi:hypothetical protein
MSDEPPFNGPAEGVYRQTRCGLRYDGKLQAGHCGKPLRSPVWYILGRPMHSSVCEACYLKRDVVTDLGTLEPLSGRKKQHAEALARLLGVSPEEAAARAYEAFGYLVERKDRTKPKPEPRHRKPLQGEGENPDQGCEPF